MPSLSHEQLVELFQRAPELLLELVRGAVDLPTFNRIEVKPGDLTQLIPISHRVDVLVLLVDGTPVFALLCEVQLGRDPDKLEVWPFYQPAARLRHHCPACLVVYAPDPSVALWASQPIDTGQPGSPFTPLVFGPSAIPKVTDPFEAAEHPHRAVLSAIAHGRTPEGLDIAKAAVLALTPANEDERAVWHSVILAALDQAARKALEEWMNTANFPIEDLYVFQRGEARGRAEGEATALLTVLRARGFTVPDPLRTRILACTDPDQLTSWIERATTASSLEEVFAPAT